eukprot:scaffold109698_cov60-Phaeocystis_antarctica.AAC.2
MLPGYHPLQVRVVPNAIKVKGGAAPPMCQLLLEPVRDEISRLAQTGFLMARQHGQSAALAEPQLGPFSVCLVALGSSALPGRDRPSHCLGCTS